MGFVCGVEWGPERGKIVERGCLMHLLLGVKKEVYGKVGSGK